MKKPEFPKPRLIRDDFLPEQDTMENYRIKKVTEPNKSVWYYPQKKILGFLWWNIGDTLYGAYSCFELANNRIIEDYESHLEDFVEYLSPTGYKTESNPPLKYKKSNE